MEILSMLELKVQQTVDLPAGEEARAMADIGGRSLVIAGKATLLQLEMLAPEALVRAVCCVHCAGAQHDGVGSPG